MYNNCTQYTSYGTGFCYENYVNKTIIHTYIEECTTGCCRGHIGYVRNSSNLTVCKDNALTCHFAQVKLTINQAKL